MNSYTVDAFLRMIYKKIARGQVDHAMDTISYIMTQIEDKNVRYQLFVAWADLALDNSTKAHDIIRDLHYRLTASS